MHAPSCLPVTLLTHPLPLHACGGTLSPVAGSFSHPHFGAPTLPFAHCPTHTPSPLACMQGHTITLLHPHFGAPTLPFACSSPAWVAPCLTHMPFVCTRGHHSDGAGCTIPCPMCPLPLHMTLPFVHVLPVLLHPQHAHKGRGHAGRVGCINWGGGIGVVQAEGTVGGHVCRVGA